MHTINLAIHPPIIAHRGASALAPENTLGAFKKAKQLGLQWVEFDVMLTNDHQIIVFHDETLERTTNGFGNVIDYSYAFLKTLNAGANESIPTLYETLICLSELGLSANIEIKALPDQDVALVKSVADMINDFQLNLLFSSFSRHALLALARYLPNYPRGFLMHEWQDDWRIFCDEIAAQTVNVNQAILQKDRIYDIKASHRLLLAYTVNTVTLANQLLSSGVDALFSDCPLEMVEKGVLDGYDRIIDDLRRSKSL